MPYQAIITTRLLIFADVPLVSCRNVTTYHSTNAEGNRWSSIRSFSGLVRVQIQWRASFKSMNTSVVRLIPMSSRTPTRLRRRLHTCVLADIVQKHPYILPNLFDLGIYNCQSLVPTARPNSIAQAIHTVAKLTRTSDGDFA